MYRVAAPALLSLAPAVGSRTPSVNLAQCAQVDLMHPPCVAEIRTRNAPLAPQHRTAFLEHIFQVLVR